MSEETKKASAKKPPKVTAKKAPVLKEENKAVVNKGDQFKLGRKPYPNDKKYKLTVNQRATLAGKGKSASDIKKVWTGKELNADPRTHYFNVKEV